MPRWGRFVARKAGRETRRTPDAAGSASQILGARPAPRERPRKTVKFLTARMYDTYVFGASLRIVMSSTRLREARFGGREARSCADANRLMALSVMGLLLS